MPIFSEGIPLHSKGKKYLNKLDGYQKIDYALFIRPDLFSNEFIEAVKQNGLALKYVKKQTNELCLEAVKQNGCALQYVKIQTSEICLEAVKQNINSLKYINIKHIKFINKYLKTIIRSFLKKVPKSAKSLMPIRV